MGCGGQTLFSGKEFDNIRFVKVDYNAMLSWDTGDSTRKDIYIMPSWKTPIACLS